MLEVILFLTAIGAGFLGALLGLGGGIVIIPVLTLLCHVHIRYAVAASLISVVASSTGAAATYIKGSFTNLRLAVFLEMGTVLGAILGFLISAFISPRFLYLLFGGFLFLSAIAMLRKREEHVATENHPWSEALRLDGVYPATPQRWVQYKVQNAAGGLLAMFGAGVLSALLGIGSGIMKVIAMDGMMKLPIKVSSATSNFMIGVTAAASAGAFFLRGDVHPELATPVAIGIIVGSYLGSKVMVRMPTILIRRIFVVVLGIVSIQMILRGLQ